MSDFLSHSPVMTEVSYLPQDSRPSSSPDHLPTASPKVPRIQCKGSPGWCCRWPFSAPDAPITSSVTPSHGHGIFRNPLRTLHHPCWPRNLWWAHTVAHPNHRSSSCQAFWRLWEPFPDNLGPPSYCRESPEGRRPGFSQPLLFGKLPAGPGRPCLRGHSWRTTGDQSICLSPASWLPWGSDEVAHWQPQHRSCHTGQYGRGLGVGTKLMTWVLDPTYQWNT